MQVVVELWKARPGWFERSQAERAAYLERVVPAIRQLLLDGVELLAIGSAEPGRTDYAYWAVWRFPHEHHVSDFAHAIESVGWHEHFERVNVEVEARDLEELLSSQTNFG
jgi:hypothetical protein